jgi:UDP-GlcNAc:undecaprenyl-phosphate GlcNAc-1-phosphate transferase
VISFWLAAVVAFLISGVTITFLRSIAHRLALVDKPGGRKIHDDDVPVVGGMGIFLGMFVAVGLLPEDARPDIQFVIVSAIFVIMGLIDDRFGLSPRFRLIVQLSCAVWLAADADLSARYLGEFVGTTPAILREIPAIALTAVLIAGGVNAFNMVDGIDGLAATLGLIAISSLAQIAMQAGLAVPLGVATAMAGALTAFLIFNFPLTINRSLRCFMGDAGSLLVGFCIAWLMLVVSQSPAASIQPMALLFLAAVPIFDLFWVFGNRLARRQSPFKADNSHLHHLLISAGASRVQALIILGVFAAVLAVVGVSMVGSSISSIVLLGVFVSVGILTVFLVLTAGTWLAWMGLVNVEQSR